MSIKSLILEAQTIVEALGLRAVISPNDLNPPCVLIGSPRFTMQNAISGGFVAEIPVEVIARSLTWRDLEWLYDTAPVVADALSGREGNPTVYRLSDGRELPAYTILIEGN
jgi:hypothetical protein